MAVRREMFKRSGPLSAINSLLAFYGDLKETTMAKAEGSPDFNVGDLLARNADGALVLYDSDAAAGEPEGELVGIAGNHVPAGYEDSFGVRVIMAAWLVVEEINLELLGAGSTVYDLIELDNVSGTVFPKEAFADRQVVQIRGIGTTAA